MTQKTKAELLSESKASNIEFWNNFEATDPQYTKNSSVSGQHRTTVDAQYKKKNISKAFGMYGRGWGIEVGSEEYERAHFSNETCILHYRSTAFYVYQGERYSFPIAASIKEAYVTNAGKGYLKVDDEAVKKVRTDALTKGFTDLGFNSDVHMGKFDDQDYVAGAAAKAAIDNDATLEAAREEAINGIKEYCKQEIDSISKLTNDNAFIAAMTRLKQKVDTRCIAAGISSKSYIKRIDDLTTERKTKGEQK